MYFGQAVVSGLFIIISLFLSQTHGLKCYSCTLTVPSGGTEGVDMSCLNDPAHVVGKAIITCPARMKWCVVVRNDLKLTESVSSMVRNCAETPIFENEDIESDEMITHYRSCQKDLCNSGKGDEDPTEGNDTGDAGIGGMIVPGTSAAAATTAFLTLYLFAFVVNLAI